jgi:two-component system cell cycle response regulator
LSQKLLIIDDSEIIHSLVKARLQGESVEIHSALHGQEGLERALALRPDLILLDVEMPAPNGFEVCRLLKAQAETSDIPVIFLTSETSTEQKIRGLDLGAIDYVTKPFEPAELRARVRASLRTKYLIDLLARKAMIDALTGLWNRNYFDQQLVTQTAASTRHARPLTCIMIDLDRFKSINDRYGHSFGDDVLRRVGHLLAEDARQEDIICRYGGEEFVCLVPDTPSPGGTTFAERLRLSIDQTVLNYRTGPVRISASFGVAQYIPGETSLFIERADQALYRAKHAGRNRVEVATIAVSDAA